MYRTTAGGAFARPSWRALHLPLLQREFSLYRTTAGGAFARPSWRALHLPLLEREFSYPLPRVVSIFALLAAMVVSSFASAFEVPALTGPVVDNAGMINSDAAQLLDSSLRRLRDSGGPQINVLTIPTLDGETIEGASIKVTDAWKLGGKKEDNGVLLLVALKERKIRIEVGQGLEGDLTDLDSKRIIEDVMAPYFRKGRASDGIIAGVRAIVGKTAPSKLEGFGEEPEPQRVERHRGRSGIPLPLIIIIFILLSLFGRRGGGRRGGGGFVTGLALGALSGRGGWSGGGGSSSGGSWGGGGGGFSGGGASGGW